VYYLYVRHPVEDFRRWKEGFDKHATARQASGATGEAYVMRDTENLNEITLLLGWSNPDKARAFIQSASLKDAMRDAGVLGMPEIRILERAE
jgi:quinol monooxygenase YgiN